MPVPSPQIKNYRHKIQYPITETKNSKRIIAGYYKNKTHEIVNIKYCPIQPEICDEIIEYIKETAPKFNISGYREKSHKGDLRHIVIRNSAYNGNNLVALVLNSDGSNISNNVIDFCNAIYNKFDKVTGVCVNFNPKKSNVI
ncbi:MAG TPA: 23S rRNA (uracil-5-)-methyltransferase RumA, partial [Cyanobacteria bacterium UBA11991]|nr:23S rRNA (uracil-5-)-methyltransferase RumA [Cyanobacteria bacterium UBA11991]